MKILVMLWFLSMQVCNAQDIWRIYTKENSGISYNYIAKIKKDNSNNFWIGCRVGLNYWNRDSFVVYDKSNSPFTVDQVLDLHVDYKNRLFIGSYGGGLYMFEHGQWTNKNFSNSIIPSGAVGSISSDSFGLVWIATDGGLVKMDSQLNSLSLYDKNNSTLPNNDIREVYVDSKNNLWLGVWSSGIFVFKDEEFINMSPPLDRGYTGITEFENKILCFHENMYTVDSNYFIDTLGIIPTQYTSLKTRDYTIDKYGRIWTSWSNNLLIYDPKTDELRWVTNENSPLPSNLVYSHIIDPLDSNIAWLGTWGGGLVRWDYVNDTTDYLISKETFVKILRSQDKLQIYPNPSSGQVLIKLNKTTTLTSQIRVLDAQGREYLQQFLSNPRENIQINLSHLASGLYYVFWESEEGSFYASLSLLSPH